MCSKNSGPFPHWRHLCSAPYGNVDSMEQLDRPSISRISLRSKGDKGRIGVSLVNLLTIIMKSKDETREHDNEVSFSEISEGSSFICNDESMEDADYFEKQTNKDQADGKEKFEDIECREDETKESLEDEDCKQYLKENETDENTDENDKTDEESLNFENIGRGDVSSLGGGDKEDQCSGGSEITNESSSKTVGNEEKHEKWTSDLEVLMEPGRRGWIREVVYSRAIENHITYASYLTPLDNGGRKRLKSTKDITDYLAKNKQDSGLTNDNFCITSKVLGLGSGFEISRKSRQNHLKPNQYQDFFKVVEGSSPATVTCNLCGIQGKVELYNNFSDHMRRHHLPDQTCSKCNTEIPSRIFSKHKKVCDGSKPKLPRPSPRNYSQFFTKLEEGAFPSQVSCNLCSSTVPSLNYSLHFNKRHMSRPICPKCNGDFSHGMFSTHLKLCDGSGTRRSAPTLYTQFYTQLKDTLFVSCKLCDEQIVKKTSYLSHFERFHEPSNECKICKKKFRYKRNIDEHMKSVHEEQKEACPKCQKEFKHVRLHTKFCGMGKQKCPKCKKKTLRLKFHLKTCVGRSKEFTWAELIIEAISKSEKEKLTLSGIISYLTQNYPSYKIKRNIISNILSSKK